MILKNIHAVLYLFLGLFLATTVSSQDPAFYIYLCFGQSNMEGQGTIELADRTVDSRLQVMEALDCSNLGRTMGSWYTALPPLCRCYNGLSPADYFGRTMVLNLPANVRIGIVNVAVGGCQIELFDKENYQAYAATAPSWMTDIINSYGGNPYARLVEIAKLAREDGVIKGILMHQGESNTGDTGWTSKVKGVYDNLIADLDLDPGSVPLLAGEVVNADQGGVCASMNAIIATLPQTIPNSYVVSSKGCTAGADKVHFNSAGYREIGKRYAVKMLSAMGYDPDSLQFPDIPSIDPPENVSVYFEPECASIGGDWEKIGDAGASNGGYVMVRPGMESIPAAPAESSGYFYFPFTVNSTGNYRIFARLNCPGTDHDSFWVKMDDRAFTMVNGLTTSGWEWIQMTSFMLAPGEHTLTIAYREKGSQLDKLYISNDAQIPPEMGGEAENVCETGLSTDWKNLTKTTGYVLGQNDPNPSSGKTNIGFEIPIHSFVSLKVFNALGFEIAELAGRECIAGKYILEFDPGKLSPGIYFYRLTTDGFSASRFMVIQK